MRHSSSHTTSCARDTWAARRRHISLTVSAGVGHSCDRPLAPDKSPRTDGFSPARPSARLAHGVSPPRAARGYVVFVVTLRQKCFYSTLDCFYFACVVSLLLYIASAISIPPSRVYGHFISAISRLSSLYTTFYLALTV